MGGSYILVGSNFEKYGKLWKNGRIRPDWGNSTWGDMAALGSSHND